jgi:hypothetical protein
MAPRSEGGASKDKSAPADPLDFADYILYYKKAHAPCEELRALVVEVAQAGEVICQDVDDIAAEARPKWLWCVPTVVPLKALPGYATMQPLHGSEALKYARAWRAEKPRATASPPGFLFAELGAGLDDSLGAAESQGSPNDNMSLDDFIRLRERSRPS